MDHQFFEQWKSSITYPLLMISQGASAQAFEIIHTNYIGFQNYYNSKGKYVNDPVDEMFITALSTAGALASLANNDTKNALQFFSHIDNRLHEYKVIQGYIKSGFTQKNIQDTARVAANSFLALGKDIANKIG